MARLQTFGERLEHADNLRQAGTRLVVDDLDEDQTGLDPRRIDKSSEGDRTIMKIWRYVVAAMTLAAPLLMPPAARHSNNSSGPISSSSGVTTSGSRMSAPTRSGVMGYQTPNIDRIATEGVLFTDFYAEQSCTAGRASFITGQSGLRTGMTKVGLPGATLGLQKEDPTIAELLKPLGYATGQFGKNHLGDRNEFLPTVHGFDEFYGNLYHLNAEEEPELPDYPKDPAFRAKYGPRGVMDCKASDTDDPTVDPRFGKVGKQICRDTGPLTKAQDGDGRRRHRQPGRGFHPAAEGRQQAVFCLGELHPHALPHPY